MKSREEIIDSMCLTWRHDYRLNKVGICGMTEEERTDLRSKMTQIFDNDIAPHMDFKREHRKSELVHDGIIKVHSFKFTEREQRRISLGLKYGPAAVYMKDDGTFFESPASQPSEKNTWIGWVFRKFLGRN